MILIKPIGFLLAFKYIFPKKPKHLKNPTKSITTYKNIESIRWALSHDRITRNEIATKLPMKQLIWRQKSFSTALLLLLLNPPMACSSVHL